jgi:periplasmic divalent cation tolerance protein
LYNTFRADAARKLESESTSAVFPGTRGAMNPEYVVVLTTLPSDADGQAFGRALVDEKLAACVNLLPLMESVYRWEGRVEQETERQLVIKTSRDRVVALWDRVRELHPYEIPEFIVLSVVDGNEAYLRWVGDSTRT